MKIEEYTQEITSSMMELLLTADPDKNSILAYLPNSKVLTYHDDQHCKGIALLTVSNGVYELKNIAVVKECQGKGIAKLMISEVKSMAKKIGANSVVVGTGNSSLSQLALYQKCGFRMSHIESDFFKSYAEPIFENGIRCIDMVYLRAKL